MEDAPFNLNVRTLKGEVKDTLLYVTWTVAQDHLSEL